MTRRGRQFRFFSELSWPASFSRRELREWIAKIDDPKLRVAVPERWDVFAAQIAAMSSKEIYVSTDVEADGPIPGPNSMLKLRLGGVYTRKGIDRHIQREP